MFIIATNNEHKLTEIKRILQPLGIEALSLREAGISAEVEETGTTFEENALLKAEQISRISGYPSIADDSGLWVDALDGRPGVYSSRYADTDENRIKRLLREMEGVEERSARFISAVCCYFNENDRFTVRGECQGVIAGQPQGHNGFGYDPIFYLPDLHKTFAELTDGEKDAYSHRGRALRLLRDRLKERMENQL